jgi:ATP-binding cassette subfamily F protein 2
MAEDIKSGKLNASALKRTVTGVLSSRPTSRDIKIGNFSMGMNGRELIKVGCCKRCLGFRIEGLGFKG